MPDAPEQAKFLKPQLLWAVSPDPTPLHFCWV